MNLTILLATRQLKNSPVFTDLLIQTCKIFKALATGEQKLYLKYSKANVSKMIRSGADIYILTQD